jgi:hypothetical protein
LAKHEESIELYDKAIANEARNLPLVHWNKSLPLHSIGRFKEGFAEHSWGELEQTVTAIYTPHHRFRKPHWRCQRDAVVHVHTEAGYGDNIAMLRYLPLFEEFGCTVRYECDPLLLDLAQRCFPNIEMMPRAVDYPGALDIKDFDYHLPIGELPHRFGTDIDNIPTDPYLFADPELSDSFKKKLGSIKSKGRRIGVCWSSGIRVTQDLWTEKYGRSKSMRFSDVVPIINSNGSDTFISLQVGDGREDKYGNIHDVLNAKPTWEETAALIDNLDLVITVDTGVAHLAGAMGKPCWVIMQKDGSNWHFLCERPGSPWNTRNPWYPSIRVFRQTDEPGDWTGVVDIVAKKLQREASAAA